MADTDAPTSSKKAEKKPRNNNDRQQNQNRGATSSENRDNGNKPRRNGNNAQNSNRAATKVDMRKYEKMITAAHDNFSDITCENPKEDCVICCKPNHVFGIGNCRHPICIECAIRIRVLGESKTCPVCRGDVETLTFCTLDKDLATVPLTFPKSQHPDEDRFGIRFSNKVAGTKYEKYLAHVCKVCKSDDGERLEFPSFIALRQHMAMKHQLSYCHICTDNLNLFSRERKTYTRELLQRHLRIGDFDDKSFKGHPQCLFCDQKFLDADNRYKHLRKHHFFCQFCESDGTMTNVFFEKHDELKLHYKEKHWICDYEECKEMGIAFATKLELDLHKAKDHSEKRNFIELGFGQQRQPTNDRGSQSQRPRRPPQQNSEPPSGPRERIAVIPRQQQVSNPQSDPSEFTVIRSAQSRGTDLRYNVRPAYTSHQQDFPTLAGRPATAAPTVVRPSEFPRLKKAKAASPAEAPRVEEFPSLGGSSAPIRESVPVPVRVAKPIQVQKKKTPPKTAPTVRKLPVERVNDDFDDYARPEVPQAAIKVNKTLLRFDMVDTSSRPEPASKSNIKMITRTEKVAGPSQSARAPMSNDFPSLPTPSAASSSTPANSAWLQSQSKKNSVINSVTVPSGYAAAMKNQNKKGKKPKVKSNDVWSSLGRVESPPTAPQVESWQEVPLSKEAQAEKEKKLKKEEWAKRKAEIRAAVAASSLKNEENDDNKSEIDSTRGSEEAVGSVVSHSGSREEPEVWQEVGRKNSTDDQVVRNGNGKKNKNKKKQDTSISNIENVPVSSKNSEVEQQMEKPAEKPEVTTETLKEKIDALWSMPAMPTIVSSLFSNFSLSSVLGGSEQVGSPTEGIAPPPGLESVLVCPPPGLEKASTSTTPADVRTLSFKDAPYLSHSDTRKSKMEKEAAAAEMLRTKKQQNDEEEADWQTAGNPKSKKNNKNKNKK